MKEPQEISLETFDINKHIDYDSSGYNPNSHQQKLIIKIPFNSENVLHSESIKYVRNYIDKSYDDDQKKQYQFNVSPTHFRANLKSGQLVRMIETMDRIIKNVNTYMRKQYGDYINKTKKSEEEKASRKWMVDFKNRHR